MCVKHPKCEKYQKKWGPITSFYIWHIFITWVVVWGERNPKEICEKMHHYCHIRRVIPLVDDGQPSVTTSQN
jgi:hypothetical protein